MILLDELDLLEKLMPFVRCLNDFLILRNPEDQLKRETKAYRVSRMSVEQASSSSLHDGQTYRLGMYAATSSQHKRTQTQIQAWHKETGCNRRSSTHDIRLVRCRTVRSKKVDAATGAITIIADVLEDGWAR